MLGLITGVPGAKKTVFVVSKLDKIESDNKVNLAKNIEWYRSNKRLIDAYDLQNEMTYYHDDVGSGHDLKQVITILDDDYFEVLAKEYDELRPDDYYKVASIYNHIIERIIEMDVVKGFRHMMPVRTIYSNINALKIDFVRSLYDLLDAKNNVDWRKAPDGSIIVIDEVQLVEPFKQTKNKEEPIIQDLTIHRHRGFDFYFITQSANLLHVQLKDLIGLHWHITVPWGWVSKVYQYGSYRQNPNAVSIKMSAERRFNFSPNVRLFKLYKSTTINTHQKRIPYKPIILFLTVIFLAIGCFIWAVSGSKDSTLISGMTGNMKDNIPVIDNPLKEPSSSASEKIKPLQVPSAADDVGTNGGEGISSPSSSLRVFNPFTGGFYEEPLKAPVNAMMMGDKCIAFNVNGNTLINVSSEECSYLLNNVGLLSKVL